MQPSLTRALKLSVLMLLCLTAIALTAYALAGQNPGTTRQVDADAEVVETLSKLGSRGDEVKKIQQRLKQWGYYTGSVDGIFGDKTLQAVKLFQKKNGLTVDGIVGKQTLQALGLPIGGSSSGGSSGGTTTGSQNGDYYLLARIISAEARGEVYTGQVAVGAVILNRINHPSFPDTVAGVIYQPGAFSAINDGQFNEPIAESAYKAATAALSGWDPSGGAVYYFNPDKTSNTFMHSRPVIVRIGKHLFCS